MSASNNSRSSQATTSRVKELGAPQPRVRGLKCKAQPVVPLEMTQNRTSPEKPAAITKAQRAAITGGRTYAEVALHCGGCDSPDCPSCGTRNEKALQRENRVPGGSGHGGRGERAKKAAVRINRAAQRVDEKETIPTTKYSLTVHPKFHAAFEQVAEEAARQGLKLEVQPYELLLFAAEHFGFVLRTLPRRVAFGNVNGILADPRDVLESGADGDLLIAPPKYEDGLPGSLRDREGGRPTIFPSSAGLKLARRMPCEEYEHLRATYATPPKDNALGERDLDAALIHLGFQVSAGEIRLQQGRNMAANAREAAIARPGHGKPRNDDEDARALATVTRAELDKMRQTLPDELAQLRAEAREMHKAGISAYWIAREFHDRDGRHIWNNSETINSFIGEGLWRRPRRAATPAEEKLTKPKARQRRT
jgi:hypothetical protein